MTRTAFALLPSATADIPTLARSGIAPRSGQSRVDYAYAGIGPRRHTRWHPAERVMVVLAVLAGLAMLGGLL